jgi:hypothetical protein
MEDRFIGADVRFTGEGNGFAELQVSLISRPLSWSNSRLEGGMAVRGMWPALCCTAMSALHIRWLLGGISLILGLCWAWGIAAPAVGEFIFKEKELLHYAIGLVILPFITAPALLPILFGMRLIRQMTEANLRRVVGLLGILVGTMTGTCLSMILPLKPESGSTFGFIVIGTLAGIFFFLYSGPPLLHLLGGPERTPIELIGRGLPMLLALQLMMLMGDLIRSLAPIKAGYTHVLESPWEVLSFVIPCVAA